MLFLARLAAILALGAAALGAQSADSLLEEARRAAADGETEAARTKFEKALESLTDAPRRRVDVRVELADLLAESEQPRAAAEQLETAAKTLREIGAGRVELANVLLKLGGVELDVDEDEAEADYQNALSLYLAELGPAAAKTVEARAALGELYLSQDWEEGAAEQFDEAVRARRMAFGIGEELAETLETISEHERWHREERAIERRDEALRIRERLYPDPSLELARALIAEAHDRYQWDYDEKAVEMFDRALTIVWQLDDYPAALAAEAHSGMGDAFAYLDRSEQAESQYRSSIAVRRAAGMIDSDLAANLCALAEAVRAQGRSREAIGPAEECAELRRDHFEEDSYQLRAGLDALASTYREAERFEEAEAVYRELLSIYDRHDEPYEGAAAAIWSRLAGLYGESGDEKLEIEAFEQAVAAREAAFGEEDRGLEPYLANLREAYLEAGLKWKAKALRLKLNRLAWLDLSRQYEWLEPVAETERLSRRLSPTGFFVMMFLAVGLVVVPAGSVASQKLGRVALDDEDFDAEPKKPTLMELFYPEPPRHRGRFHGQGPELFGVWAINSLLTVLTAGIYYFWGKVRVRRYIWSHAEFGGDRFAFHGTPLELFVGWLKASPILLGIIWGPTILLMITQSTDYEVWATLGVMAAALLLWPVAEIGAHRYRLSRTSWSGIRFSFHGKTGRYFGIYLLNWILWIFTLGLWTPFFNAIKRRYLMNHMQFGDSEFECDARGRDMFKAYFVNWLLFLPTWGLYRYWYLAKREQYYWSRTRFRGARFRCDITGSKLFEISVIGGIATVMTLGLAWPWVRCWRMRVWLESIQLDGSLDLHQVRQNPQAATATGEGYADFLGVDFGFFE